MGRRRKHDTHLPRRFYLRAGTYYFVDIEGQWHNLGRDYAKAIGKYGELTADEPRALQLMEDLIDRYLREVSPSKAEATYKSDVAAAKPLRQFFGKMRPKDVETQHCYLYLDERSKVAKVRPNREIALLSAIFRKAIRWGVVKMNPVKGVERLEEASRTRDLTHEELAAFIDFCARQPQYSAKVIAYYCVFKFITALRRPDILRLRLDAIREDGIHVTPSKTKKSTGKRAVLQWTPGLAQVVRDVRAMQGKVSGMTLFQTRRGRPYTPDGFSTIWGQWRRAAIKAGVLRENFKDSDIRAAAAAELETPEQAAQLLAHASSATTEKHYRRRAAKVRPIR